MNDLDAEFFGIANDLVAREANDLLDKQLQRVKDWRAERLAHGETAELRDLISQVLSEPNKRGPVLAAAAAGMWRLLKLEGEL